MRVVGSVSFRDGSPTLYFMMYYQAKCYIPSSKWALGWCSVDLWSELLRGVDDQN